MAVGEGLRRTAGAELFTDAHDKLTADNNVGTTDMQGVIKRSAPQLRADAPFFMGEKYLGAQGKDVSTADRYQVVVHVDASVLGITAQFDGQTAMSTQAATCHIANGPAISTNTARRSVDNCTVLPAFMRHGELLAKEKQHPCDMRVLAEV